METYPTAFILPEWEGYSLEVDMGVVRTPMASGYSRQRRIYQNMPTVAGLTFVMTWIDLRAWQPWWNEHAYVWFTMEAVTYQSADPVKNCWDHTLRCISNLEIEQTAVADYCRVGCQVEVKPAIVGGGVFPSPSPEPPDWVIAGDPPAPSPTDVVIAGTPPAPNRNVIKPS